MKERTGKNRHETDKNHFIRRQKLVTFFSAIILVPAGLYTKFYQGIGAAWVHDSLGGLIYVIFWCLVFYFLFPSGKKGVIVTGVLLATCCLEFTQLWDAPFLDTIRSTFIGRAMIGNSFNWLDFPYYFLGALAGFSWIRLIHRASLGK